MLRKISFGVLVVTATPLLLAGFLLTVVGVPVVAWASFRQGFIAQGVALALLWVAFINVLFLAACDIHDSMKEN